MDKSLDEVIAARKVGQRRRRLPAKAQVLGSAANPATRAATANAAATKVAAPTTAPQPADKIMVSNLPADVNEMQIKKLSRLMPSLSRFASRDIERPMKIEIVVDPARPVQSLAARVAPATTNVPATTRVARPATRGRRAPRGRARKVNNDRPQKSVADLDAEMEDYTAANTGSAAPAASA
ncbi:hypothetical protein ID866_2101 [Astraeus odoratus]|nr:hypothetical protein ID866_2101 [Astraeus odoratus]